MVSDRRQVVASDHGTSRSGRHAATYLIATSNAVDLGDFVYRIHNAATGNSIASNGRSRAGASPSAV
jgi:hypothetical protein